MYFHFFFIAVHHKLKVSIKFHLISNGNGRAIKSNKCITCVFEDINPDTALYIYCSPFCPLCFVATIHFINYKQILCEPLLCVCVYLSVCFVQCARSNHMWLLCVYCLSHFQTCQPLSNYTPFISFHPLYLFFFSSFSHWNNMKWWTPHLLIFR